MIVREVFRFFGKAFFRTCTSLSVVIIYSSVRESDRRVFGGNTIVIIYGGNLKSEKI